MADTLSFSSELVRGGPPVVASFGTASMVVFMGDDGPVITDFESDAAHDGAALWIGVRNALEALGQTSVLFHLDGPLSDPDVAKLAAKYESLGAVQVATIMEIEIGQSN